MWVSDWYEWKKLLKIETVDFFFFSNSHEDRGDEATC